MKNVNSRRVSKLALGAAVAGILSGASMIGGCGSKDAARADANGCGGPNGCGGAKKEGAKAEANGCNGPNGCNGAHQEAPKAGANGCNGPNGCKAEMKKKG
ncbi:MAG TPA: hypothetical protein VEI02_08190 [Planctomycetota bacterium]|nr:hypothetical protein [Planctomycetota bacterium]